MTSCWRTPGALSCAPGSPRPHFGHPKLNFSSHATLVCSYLVRLTAGDLSLAEGPSLALPAHPEERRSPWTWDSRLLGDTHSRRRGSSLSSALSAVKTNVSPSAQAWKATPCSSLLNLRESSAYFTRREKWRRAAVKLSGNFPSLAFYINLLKDSICNPFVHTLPFLYQKATDPC